MPGTTPHGLPYPLPSEPVRDGAVAVRNLAEMLDPRAPFGAFVFAGNVNTNSDGYWSLNVPSGSVLGGNLQYAGVFGPIIINAYNQGGTGIGFKAWQPNGTPIASTTITVHGCIWYSQ